MTGLETKPPDSKVPAISTPLQLDTGGKFKKKKKEKVIFSALIKLTFQADKSTQWNITKELSNGQNRRIGKEAGLVIPFVKHKTLSI